MSACIKYVMIDYISVQMCRFWGLFLEGWMIFDLFDPHWHLMCPKIGKKVSFYKKKHHNWVSDAKSCIYATSSYHYLRNSKLLSPFWPRFDYHRLESDTCMEICSGYKPILKKNPYFYQKLRETNLSKIIKNILALDLSVYWNLFLCKEGFCFFSRGWCTNVAWAILGSLQWLLFCLSRIFHINFSGFWAWFSRNKPIKLVIYVRDKKVFQKGKKIFKHTWNIVKQISLQFSVNNLIEVSGKSICVSIFFLGMHIVDSHVFCDVHHISSFAIQLQFNFSFKTLIWFLLCCFHKLFPSVTPHPNRLELV